MIRIAILSFWHVHAQEYALDSATHPDTEIVAVWDEVPERGRAEAEKRGVPFFEDLDELLAQPNVDAVVVDAPTSMHHRVMLAAANAGKHIFTEKVIAATLSEAQEIIDAADRTGAIFFVCLRRVPFASTRTIKHIIEQGHIGDVSLVLVRDGHSAVLPTPTNPRGFLSDEFLDPALALGGVLIDMCHSMYLTRSLLGAPESVTATFGYKSGRAIEDNAVVTMRAANGAIGIAQASFVVRAAPFAVEVHGTEGSIIYTETGIGEMIDRRSRNLPAAAEDAANVLDGKLRVYSTKSGHDGWLVEDPAVEAAPNPFDQWVSHIKAGTRPDENIALGLQLSEIMEAAYRSAATGQAVSL